jgi:hypothetical protein
VVDPAGAEVTGGPFEQSDRLNHYSLESVIRRGDRVVVEGEFRGEDIAQAVRGAAGRLVMEWKQDMPALLARFDADGDGALHQREWDAVLAEAQRQAQAQAANLPRGQHFGKPRDGRLYLISIRSEEELDRQFKYWLAGHLLGLIVFGMALAALTAHFARIGRWA